MPADDRLAQDGDANWNVRCSVCGYSLRGLPVGARCPECGACKPVCEDGVPFIAKPEQASPVPHDSHCVRCGRQLQSLSSHDACPGCGIPAWLSLCGDWLCVADPAWLRKVRRGVGLFAISLSIVLLVYFLVFMLALAWAQVPYPASVITVERVANSLIPLAGAIVALLAVWLITARDPGRRAVEPTLSLRQLLRILALTYLAERAASAGLEFAGLAWDEWPGWLTVLFRFVGLSGEALTVGMIIYVRRLCRRLPHRRLARQMSIALWGFAGIMAFWLVDASLFCVTGRWLAEWAWHLTSSRAVIHAFSGVVILAFVVFAVWLLVVLVRFRPGLTRALSDAAKW